MEDIYTAYLRSILLRTEARPLRIPYETDSEVRKYGSFLVTLPDLKQKWPFAHHQITAGLPNPRAKNGQNGDTVVYRASSLIRCFTPGRVADPKFFLHQPA